MARLRLEGLAKCYPDGTQAVRPLSLTVKDGEFLVIMGPSGCGKSTLLRLIAGLEEPSGGRIHLGDRDVTRDPPARRDVAMVFQAYALYPHMTVAENLAFPLRMRHVSRGDCTAQVTAVADQLRLTRLLDRRPRDLSGGEQQRVALGRALIRRPRLFLLDEPLSNLDAALRGELRDEIRALHAATGTTMLYVTHDQQEALALAERLALMQAGAILQVDTPAQLYAAPATLDVARGLGQPRINCVAGRPETTAGGAVVCTDGGRLPLPAWSGQCRLPDRVVFALRSEHVALGERTAASVEMRLLRVEGTGPDRIAWLTWGGEPWAVRVGADVSLPGVGAPVHVTMGTEAAYLFDAADGAAIRPQPA